jgi:hypothetical protein
VIWLTLSLQPTPGFAVPFSEAMKQGAALLFLSDKGFLTVFNGHPDVRDWVILKDHPFPLGELIQVRLRLDYRNKTWSVWFGNTLLADRLGFANPDKTSFSSISFEGTGILDAFDVAAHGPDDDHDDIPDDWERTYFGDLDKARHSTDSDADGFPDQSEYLAGTDPHDASSLLEITGVRLDGRQLQITWQSKLENYEGNPISYNLLRSKRLAGGVMPPAACGIVPEGTMCTYTIEGSTNDVANFYSIEANP